MSNNKQSSIDWFIDTMYRSAGLDQHQIDLIIEQAKAMHEEETIDFGNDLLAQNDTNYTGFPNLAEQYYNETFGGNK